MQRKLIMTSDGSHSISIPELNVTYHSVHGAFQESMHVFIKAGLIRVMETAADPFNIKIFEFGFGTGLNALLTLLTIEELDLQIHYETIEPFPLEHELVAQLNYCGFLERPDLQPAFEMMHTSDYDIEIEITKNFFFKKLKLQIEKHLDWKTEYDNQESMDLIYFDAFDPTAQPELWTKEIFEKMFSIMKPGGIFVTYSSKGEVRRAMKSIGFKVEKIPGPAGKREITRATKIL